MRIVQCLCLSSWCSFVNLLSMGQRRWRRIKNFSYYQQGFQWHYSARSIAAWITCFGGCSQIPKYPLHIWQGPDISWKSSKRGLLNPCSTGYVPIAWFRYAALLSCSYVFRGIYTRAKLAWSTRNFNSDRQLSSAAQLVLRVWNACPWTAWLQSIYIVLQPYLFHSNCVVMFDGLVVLKKVVVSSGAEHVMPKAVGL